MCQGVPEAGVEVPTAMCLDWVPRAGGEGLGVEWSLLTLLAQSASVLSLPHPGLKHEQAGLLSDLSPQRPVPMGTQAAL